jgi:hypothetical protein
MIDDEAFDSDMRYDDTNSILARVWRIVVVNKVAQHCSVSYVIHLSYKSKVIGDVTF